MGNKDAAVFRHLRQTMKKTMRINKRICGRKNSSNTVTVLMKPQMN